MDFSRVIDCLMDVYSTLIEQKHIAKELTIFSKLVYKFNNAHKHQKYFHAIKKIENNMQKYANLKLIPTLKHDLKLMK